MPYATDVIRHEHTTLQVIARILDEMLARHEAGESLSVQDMPSVVGFFVKYADSLHHAKEEHLLFPALLRHHPQSITLLDRLLDEHQQFRRIAGDMAAALDRGDQAAYFAAVRGFLTLVVSHIEVEEDLLLPAADSFFSEEEQAELAAQLAVIDVEQLPALDMPSWRERQRALEARYLSPQ